jgi:hypothetical protein
VAFFLPPAPVLLAVPAVLAVPVLLAAPVLPFSADPQRAPIRATMARAASDRRFLLMFLSARGDCVVTSSHASVLVTGASLDPA